MDDLIHFLPVIARGLLTTLLISVPAFALALVLGAVFAAFRISGIAPLQTIGLVYVEAIRNAPLLLILLMLIFGIPDVGIMLSLEVAVVIGLGLYSGTYVCETVRSGINGVDRGVVEAARAGGLTTRHVLSEVLFPLSIRSMIPSLANVFISTVLGSALAAAVGVTELTGATRVFNLDSAQPFLAFGLAALGYLIINLPIGWLSARGERQFGVAA